MYCFILFFYLNDKLDFKKKFFMDKNFIKILCWVIYYLNKKYSVFILIL